MTNKIDMDICTKRVKPLEFSILKTKVQECMMGTFSQRSNRAIKFKTDETDQTLRHSSATQ